MRDCRKSDQISITSSDRLPTAGEDISLSKTLQSHMKLMAPSIRFLDFARNTDQISTTPTSKPNFSCFAPMVFRIGLQSFILMRAHSYRFSQRLPLSIY